MAISKECREAGKKVSRKKRERAIEKYYEDPNYCLHCGDVIHVTGKMRVREARVKKFCSRSHAASYNNRTAKKKEDKKCLACSRPVGRRNKYCNVKCQGEYEYVQYINSWLAGKIDGNIKDCTRSQGVKPSARVNRWLREDRGDKCEECGWCRTHPVTGKVPLQTHHKDGNSSRTVPENLSLLCAACHSLTENWGALNA